MVSKIGHAKDDLKKYTWNIRPSARVEAIYTEQGLRLTVDTAG
jgi:hypothetical protein